MFFSRARESLDVDFGGTGLGGAVRDPLTIGGEFGVEYLQVCRRVGCRLPENLRLSFLRHGADQILGARMLQQNGQPPTVSRPARRGDEITFFAEDGLSRAASVRRNGVDFGPYRCKQDPLPIGQPSRPTGDAVERQRRGGCLRSRSYSSTLTARLFVARFTATRRRPSGESLKP